jgi:prolyl oligopeptidase
VTSPLAPARPPAPLTYPVTRTADQVDDYHGTVVADPFRWLEDDTSAETKEWVEAQNRVSFAYLDQLPSRDALRARLTELVNYPRYSAPSVKRQWSLFTKNDGLQNQAVYYLQDGADGVPVVLIDPNTLSADGTTRVAGLTFDRAGTRIAYMRSEAGSDWQQIRVIDVATREHLQI